MAGTALVSPATAQIYEADGTEEGAGSIITLESDAAADNQPYWLTITRSDDGVVLFDGLAPDETIRDALGIDIEGADVSGVEVSSGAPDQYESAAELGRQVIGRLVSGRFSVRGDMLTIKGEAATQENAAAIAAFTDDIPDGLILILNEVSVAETEMAPETPETAPEVPEMAPETPELSPETAINYTFSATKTVEGVTFGGSVPTEQLASYLAVRAGSEEAANVAIAGGAPDDFITEILLTLELLDQLETGEITYETEGWSISVTPAEDADIEALVGDRDWALSLESASVSTKNKPAEPIESTSESETETAIDPTYAFSASKPEGGAMTLSGTVPADSARRYIGVVGQADPAGLDVASGAPEGFTETAVEGVRALAAMQSGELDFSNGQWTLSGTAVDSDSAETLSASLSALDGWRVDIAAPDPADLCRQELAAFSDANPILFASGSSQIAGSQAAIDELTAFLGDCPDMPVYIEGHTDTDGGASTNLALSVARAESVVAALIERGVEAGRLYAVGYGESDPIASNDTAEGKQRNRRIVVTLDAGES